MATESKSPAIDPAGVPATTGSNYPEPYKRRVAGRSKQRLGDALGLRNFGVNLTTLAPGAQSALRHWHAKQDEFIYVIEGEVTLVTDAGRQKLKPGMAAGFPAGRPDGHQLVNDTGKPALYLEIGDRTPDDSAAYPDVDLAVRMIDGKWVFTHKDGSPFK